MNIVCSGLVQFVRRSVPLICRLKTKSQGFHATKMLLYTKDKKKSATVKTADLNLQLLVQPLCFSQGCCQATVARLQKRIKMAIIAAPIVQLMQVRMDE